MRPHIDFVQAQHLAWEDAAPLGMSGARMKVLSRDDHSGALSCVLELPAGAIRQSAPLSFDEEIYLLDGTIEIGGVRYGENAYAFLPSGFGENAIASPRGAHLLYFRSDARPAGVETDAELIASRLVRQIDVSSGQWDGDFDKFGLGAMKAGARMRVLREDPVTGETTYITATIAFRRGERAERHPIVQEFFLLSGELAGELGTMQAGAYCFRPPMEKHGPYGSPTGALILFRGLGGRQETYWEDADPFSFFPTHQPILPEEMRAAGAPVQRPTRY